MSLSRWIQSVCALAMLPALAGCQGLAAGQGASSYAAPAEAYPITLSITVRKRLERYAKEEQPLAFLIAKDGGYSVYWRCNGTNCFRPDADYIEAAQKFCRQFGHQGDCLVHSVRDRKIWQGPENFETEVRARLTVPWKFTNQGPESAKGIILYVPGYGGHRFPPSLDHERVPAYLWTLNQSGYDVIRLNFAHYDMGIQNDAEINQRIVRAEAELRDQGYDRVFAAGQSRGAWQILGALKAGLSADAAILMVPAAHGREVGWDGRENKRHARGSDDFDKLVQGLPDVPLLFGFFDGDEYDTGGRQESLMRHHPERVGETIRMIDRPGEFAGHSAAGHTGFRHAYGDCLDQFLDRGTYEETECRHALEPNNDRHATTRPLLIARQAKQLTGANLKSFISARAFHPLTGNPGWWGMLAGPDGELLQWFPGSYLSGNTHLSRWETTHDRFCLIESRRHSSNRYCYEVWELPSGNTGLVAPDGFTFVIASRPAKSVADLDFTPGDWKGGES